MLKYIHLEQTDSTNAYLQRKQSECDIRSWVVSADEQTAGKGMGNNSWESEVGKNLTFSLALDVSFLPAERQFLLSEAVPLGIIEVLDKVLSDSFEGMSLTPSNAEHFHAETVRLESMPSKQSDNTFSITSIIPNGTASESKNCRSAGKKLISKAKEKVRFFPTSLSQLLLPMPLPAVCSSALTTQSRMSHSGCFLCR